MGAVTLGTGPGVISSQPDKYGYDSNGYGSNVSGGGGYRPRQQQGVSIFFFSQCIVLGCTLLICYSQGNHLCNSPVCESDQLWLKICKLHTNSIHICTIWQRFHSVEHHMVP